MNEVLLNFKNLKHLNLENNKLTLIGIKHIISNLSYFKKLENLNINGNNNLIEKLKFQFQ